MQGAGRREQGAKPKKGQGAGQGEEDEVRREKWGVNERKALHAYVLHIVVILDYFRVFGLNTRHQPGYTSHFLLPAKCAFWQPYEQNADLHPP